MNINRNYLIIGSSLLGIVFVYYLASSVVPRMLVTYTKAAPATVVSLADSYVLGEKLLAKADGKDACVINVFIMDSSGKGVGGKSVELTGVKGVTPEMATTNKEGKASFKIVSEEEGTFAAEAVVGGTPVGRTVKVTFRN